MKIFSLSILLAICVSATAQVHTFKPMWKKGTTKMLTMEQVEREFENDTLISDTTTYNEASIRVIDVSETDYTLEVIYENQALTAAMELYDKLDEELEDYQDLKLLISVNKKTAETELINWEETQEFMNASFEQISKVFEVKAPESAALTGLLFMPLKEMFKSKENVEAYMLDQIGFVFVPFQHKFELGEPISTTENTKNPFNPRSEITSTTILTMQSFDSATGACVIDQEVQLDLSEFIEMMKSMMKSMANSFGVDEESADAKAEEMDEFEMDITNVQTIHFNANTTWVEKAVSTGLATGTDPQKGTRNRKEVVMTTTLK